MEDEYGGTKTKESRAKMEKDEAGQLGDAAGISEGLNASAGGGNENKVSCVMHQGTEGNSE
jgi:hypothetical protein